MRHTIIINTLYFKYSITTAGAATITKSRFMSGNKSEIAKCVSIVAQWNNEITRQTHRTTLNAITSVLHNRECDGHRVDLGVAPRHIAPQLEV